MPMRGPGLDQAIPPGDRVLLDSTVLLAYFNGNEPISPLSIQILDDFVRRGRNEAVVSMVTVMEILIRPLRQSTGTYRHVIDFLRNFPHLRPVDIDLVVAQEAASLRAIYNFAPPDALIIGSGIVTQVGHLVTNDSAWRTRLRPISARIRVCCLSDYLTSP